MMELIKASLLSAVMQSGGGGNVAPKPDTIVANGAYLARTDNLDGYSSVLVDVPSGSFERITSSPQINGGGFSVNGVTLQSCNYAVHRCALGRCDQEEWVYSATNQGYAGHDAAVDTQPPHDTRYCYPWLRSVHHSKPFWVVLKYRTEPILAVMSRIGQSMTEADGEVYWQKSDYSRPIELPDGSMKNFPLLDTYTHDKYEFSGYSNTDPTGSLTINTSQGNRLALSVHLTGTVYTNHTVYSPDGSETTTRAEQNVDDTIALIATGAGNATRVPQIWCADTDLAHSALEAILSEAIEASYSTRYPNTWKIHFS
jgi:hypothetical protein